MSWFPDKQDAELERLAQLVFDLRRELFRLTQYRHAHEREWETEEDERRREEGNARAVMKWDNDTLRLILGIADDGEGVRS